MLVNPSLVRSLRVLFVAKFLLLSLCLDVIKVIFFVHHVDQLEYRYNRVHDVDLKTYLII